MSDIASSKTMQSRSSGISMEQRQQNPYMDENYRLYNTLEESGKSLKGVLIDKNCLFKFERYVKMKLF